jgi:hypothetical protein
MADHGLRWRKTPGPVTKVLGSVGVSALVQSLGDQELDEPSPKVVWQTPRSSQLRALAFELAEAGRDDPEAIGELVRAAGRHPKELRRAAATIRADGLTEEEVVAFRANQLLVAAASGRTVEPMSAEKLAWFAEKRHLARVPSEVDPQLTAGTEPAAMGVEPGDIEASEP